MTKRQMETEVALGRAEELDEEFFYAIRFYASGAVLRLRPDLPKLPVKRGKR